MELDFRRASSKLFGQSLSFIAIKRPASVIEVAAGQQRGAAVPSAPRRFASLKTVRHHFFDGGKPPGSASTIT
jgi:hypothetical protein